MTTAENELLERLIIKIINDNNTKIIRHINRAVKTAFREAVDELNRQETLDSKACAEYLQIKRDALYKMVTNNELPHIRIGKRKLLFIKKDLQKYLENNNSNT